MPDNLHNEEKSFVEDFGIVFEQQGMPRMAGRVLGWLLICDPPHQSPGELVTALMASKGSISTMTRFLIQIGLIERFTLPGVRHDYFRIKPGVVHYLLKQRVDQITILRQLTERGLELIKNKTPQARQSLLEMYGVYAFFEREFPTLLERWEQESKRDELKTK